MKNLFLLFSLFCLPFNLALQAKNVKMVSRQNDQRLIQINKSKNEIIERYSAMMPVLIMTDSTKKSNEIKKHVIDATQEWKKNSWFGTFTKAVEGRNVYDSRPFVQYEKSLSADICELSQNARALKKSTKLQSEEAKVLQKELEDLVNELGKIRKEVQVHDRYVQEMDKLEIKACLR